MSDLNKVASINLTTDWQKIQQAMYDNIENKDVSDYLKAILPMKASFEMLKISDRQIEMMRKLNSLTRWLVVATIILAIVTIVQLFVYCVANIND